MPDKPCLHFKYCSYIPVVFQSAQGDGHVDLGSVPGAGPEFLSPAQRLCCSQQFQAVPGVSSLLGPSGDAETQVSVPYAIACIKARSALWKTTSKSCVS